jgi:uncharacterized protein
MKAWVPEMAAGVDEIFTQMTAGGITPRIKADDVEKFVASPITYWCDLFAPQEAKDPINDFQQLLFDYGHSHQNQATSRLFGRAAQQMFTDELEGFRRTLALMAQGTSAMANMPLLCWPLGIQGRPDLLVRMDGVPSRFGDYSYQVVEIKSAKNIKRSHRLQAALYNRLLGQVQGYEPSGFAIVNRDFQTEHVAMTDMAPSLEATLSTMRAIARGEAVVACHGAANWPWETYVNSLALAANDVSLVSGVGDSTRALLAAEGIETVTDLASSDEEALTRIKGIGDARARRFLTSARALMSGRVVPRGPAPRVAAGQTQVFLDLEGSLPEMADEGPDIVNYLIGNVVRQHSAPSFVPFFADAPDGEGQNLLQFFDWAMSLEDAVFYHWSDYERIHLSKMALKYAVDEDRQAALLGRLVDLRKVATAAFAFPTRGEGLKPIARHLGFAWRQDDVDAMASVALYSRYTGSGGADREAKTKILTYNEDDCRATMHVFDWLAGQGVKAA